jgi:hypothetical protein
VRRSLLLAATVLAIVPASASATSAGLDAIDRYGHPYHLHVYGDPREDNRTRLTFDAGGVTIRDSGARSMTARTGCVAVDAATLRCERPSAGVIVRGLDGDDHLIAPDADLPGWGIELAGGPGDDRIDGSPWDDRLDGGPGRDVVHGGAGDDLLANGEIRRRDIAEDRFTGGPGRDAVSWEGRTSRVHVDLVRPAAGSAGERDRLVSVEGAVGGNNRDVLLGSAGRDDLHGGGGRDRIARRCGGGRLVGGRGRDLLIGGPGGDRLEDSGSGYDTDGPDRVRCGRGDDVVTQGPADLVTVTCERLKLLHGTVRLDLRLRDDAGDTIALLRGHRTRRGPPALRLTAGRVVARGRRLRLSTAGRRLMRGRRCVVLTLVVDGDVQSFLRACRR